QAAFIIGIGAGPIAGAISRRMPHRLEVANRVVVIVLGISPQALQVVLRRRSDKRIIPIISIGRRESRLALMFPPFGVRQPVERIVSVIASRFDLLAIE